MYRKHSEVEALESSLPTVRRDSSIVLLELQSYPFNIISVINHVSIQGFDYTKPGHPPPNEPV